MRLFKRKRHTQIDFDEILVDATNLPSWNQGRLEGRLETPISQRAMYAIGVVFGVVLILFGAQLVKLQIVEGDEYAARSANNHFNQSVIFAERGVIYDRTGERLAWNAESSRDRDFAERVYTDRRGLGQVLGYVNYPRKDASGFYFRTEYVGRGGAEGAFDADLRGINGEQLIEVDALGNVISEHVVHDPEAGKEVRLTINAALSEALYDHIATSAARVDFRSGAGAIMDVETGELVAMASYPAFDPEAMTVGDAEAIESYNQDDRLPFLNKIISGIYTPGSIVKPFVALGALAEDVISPEKIIVSTGALTVPNPYNPSAPTVFRDWKAHGEVDMRRAIAVSSNVYFFVIGGGFGDQKGLGITKLDEHLARFKLADKTGISLGGEESGVIPDPAWKQEMFEDEWRLGDTYNTAIGQFGFQVTPLAMLRAYAAIANGGTLLKPLIRIGEAVEKETIPLDQSELAIVKEGMRMGAIEGTARTLNRSDVAFAGKTGTAELGAKKEYVNSWVVGFYPYEKPKYAFILLMERGPRANLFGAAPIMSQFFSWVALNEPEYLYVGQEEQ